MPITKGAIKVMASENLTDYDDGGGMMSGTEIVSGNVNNLFPDISPLDRALGRVSLRKCYSIAMTDDNDTYQGCHVILTDPPDDPLVSVSLFTTGSHLDRRSDAKDRIESWVVQSVKYTGYLLGNQLEGARAIQIVQRETTALPRVGDVLYIVENEGNVNEISQYVRITELTHEVRVFSVQAGSSYVDITRRVSTCGIGDPLRYTFHGAEPNYADAHGLAVPHSTMVADAARYYGVKKVIADVVPGSFTVQADSIFNHLVPSAQAESPVIDISAAGAVIGAKQSGSSMSFNVSLNVNTGSRIYCGCGIVRGSLSVVNSGSVWSDDRRGNLTRAGAIEGVIDYGAGIVTFQVAGASGTHTVSCVPAVQTHGINRTHGLEVTLASRSYNYTATLFPLPDAGTLTVDYMSQGNWYRLADNGSGELLPLVPGTGSGTMNTETGSLIVTCGALPDVDTSILFAWSASVEYEESGSTAVSNAFTHRFILPEHPVEPGSVGFSYEGILVSDYIDADGYGRLQGVTGTIDYDTGEIVIVPQTLSASAGIEMSINPTYRSPGITVPRKSGSMDIIAGPANSFLDIDASRADTLALDGLQYHCQSVPDVPEIPAFDVMLAAYARGGKIYALAPDQTLASGTLPDTGNRTCRTYSLIFQSGQVEAGTFDASNGDILMYGLFSATVSLKLEYKETIYANFTNGSIFSGQSVPHAVIRDKTESLTKDLAFQALSGQAGWSAYAADAEYSNNTEILQKNGTTARLGAVIPGEIVRDAVSLNIGGNDLVIINGVLYRDFSHTAGTGTIVGSLSADGELVLTAPFVTDVPNTVVFKSVATKTSSSYATDCTFRCPGAPIRPGSFYVQAEKMRDGSIISATADSGGDIVATEIRGRLSHETGIVTLQFGRMVSPAADYIAEPWYDAANAVNGAIWMPVPVRADTIRYNCVIYSYIPLDASLIGLDPVRLPQDGRVPVFRKGDLVVIHHTLQTQLAAGLTAGQQIQLPRGDLTLVELYDADGVYVPETDYSVNLASGLITMATPLNLAGFTQPLVALHRQEEMSLASDVQINGMITMTKKINRAYPAGATMVSAALAFGDLQSRVYGIFDQKTWGNVWSDDRIGDAAAATYNKLNYPIVTTNRGAIPQRWAIVFDSMEHFRVMGEDIGVIYDGYITQDCRPINPATNAPYFTVRFEGWGAGWASGNAVRFNTMAACAPLWINRTTLQGPATETDDEFRIHIRGAGN